MPDTLETSTARAVTLERSSSERRKWEAVYPTYPRGHPREGQRVKNSLPCDWICPCTKEKVGTLLAGSKSCPKCGRVPMDHGFLDAPQFVSNSRDEKSWRKFGRRC